MKNLKHVLMVCLAGFGAAMSSCSHDDNLSINDGTLEISFQSPTEENIDGRNSGRTESAATPAHVLLTIEDHTGAEVYSLESFPLVEFSGSYVSSPITLAPGSYKITEFLVTDDSNATILATPKTGSELEYLVSNPLDVDFSIISDQVNNLDLEVISTAVRTAAEFGYASFGFTTIDTFDILVSAMRYGGVFTGWELTDATVAIKGDGAAILSKNIADETTQVTVKDGFTNYEVSVSKPGYETNTATYTQAEMEAFFDDPLVVELNEE